MWTRGTSKEQLFGIASGATKTLSQRGGRCSSLKFCVSIVHVLVVPKCSLFVFIFPIFIFLVLEFFTCSLSCHLTLFNTWIGRLGSQFFFTSLLSASSILPFREVKCNKRPFDTLSAWQWPKWRENGSKVYSALHWLNYKTFCVRVWVDEMSFHSYSW